MDFVWIKPKSCSVIWEKYTKNSILFIQIPSLTFYHICSSSHSFFSSMCTLLHWSFSEPFGNKLQITSRHLSRSIVYFPQTKTINIPPFKSGNELWYRYYHTVLESCWNFASYPNNAFFSFWFRILSRNTCSI